MVAGDVLAVAPKGDCNILFVCRELREVSAGVLLNFSFSWFYSVQDPSLWDSTIHIQGESSSSVSPAPSP